MGGRSEARDLFGRLERLPEANRPDIVFYYRPSTLEVLPDHWALGAGVEESLRRYRSPSADFRHEIWGTVHPFHVLDITAVWDAKRKVEQYESQLRHNDNLHVVAGLNACRTIYLCSARYVEALEVG